MSSEPEDSKGAAETAQRSRSVRGIFLFVVAFAMSVMVGKGVEFLTTEATYADMLRVQTDWRTSLENLAPMSLATNYWYDIGHILGGGEWAWTPPVYKTVAKSEVERLLGPLDDVPIVSPECEGLFNTKNVDCNPVELRDDPDWSPAHCESIVAQAALDFAETCGAWEAQRQRDSVQIAVPPSATLYEPPGAANDSEAKGHLLIAPIAAVYRTWTRLTHGGGWNYVWAVLQLGVGVLGFMVAYASLEGNSYPRAYFPSNVWAWIFVVPAGVVVSASVLAFAFKYVMLGGLAAFGWFAELAGACCTATGVGGFCWFCFHKFAEYSVSEAIETKLK